MTHICVGNLTIIGSDNGLSPSRRQAIIWTNAGILWIGPLGMNFNEISIEIDWRKLHMKMSSAKWCPSCLGLNVLNILWPGDAKICVRDLNQYWLKKWPVPCLAPNHAFKQLAVHLALIYEFELRYKHIVWRKIIWIYHMQMVMVMHLFWLRPYRNGTSSLFVTAKLPVPTER